MTTRQLGIEVERRLQTILPTLKLENKVDTEDIYAFLNQFQKQYVDLAYRQSAENFNGPIATAIVEDILRVLTKSVTINGSSTFTLPADYYHYIRSTSNIASSYSDANRHSTLSNILLKQSDANAIIQQSYDKNRILRNPIAILKGNQLEVISDSYTNIFSIELTYIKLPAEFSILTNVDCELPASCHEDLVAGAVDLYVRHLTATQPKQQPKQREEDKQ